MEQVCLSCMAYVLRELGDWDQVERAVPRAHRSRRRRRTTRWSPTACSAPSTPGAAARARPLPLLTRCLETTTRLDVVSMQCDSAAALAWLAAQEGDAERAEEHCRLLLARWERSEDHHYALWGLRWAAGWLADTGALGLARACCEALSAIAASAGHPDALAALACALADTALADGDADAAIPQYARALEIHASLEIPFERAQILIRSGAALAAAGERDAALEQLAEAHRVRRRARRRARSRRRRPGRSPPSGASLERHLGRRAAAEHESAGLSRRELEVVRLVAEGLTNREIAAQPGAQHAHRGHARAQHPDQAAQPQPHRGGVEGRRARAAPGAAGRVTEPTRPISTSGARVSPDETGVDAPRAAAG